MAQTDKERQGLTNRGATFWRLETCLILSNKSSGSNSINSDCDDDILNSDKDIDEERGVCNGSKTVGSESNTKSFGCDSTVLSDCW